VWADVDQCSDPASRRPPVDEVGAAPRAGQQVARRASQAREDAAAPAQGDGDEPTREAFRHVPAVREVNLNDSLAAAATNADRPDDKPSNELSGHAHGDDDPDPHANGDT
jgi:hypothetical protein